MDSSKESPTGLSLWGGVECTHNRVEDRYFSQLDRSGHVLRDGDLQRFASLGLRALRYPVLWERVAPGDCPPDWSMPDARLPALRDLGITPIVGLVHHGSGPVHTSLVDPGFADGLAAFAGAVAERYPWVTMWTPVNEPLTTARFSALYGVWYPHRRDDLSFVKALLNQCRATVLAMAAIRRVNPQARLVQTDDLGKSYASRPLADIAAFYNERRWLGWDLLCGRVDEGHALWSWLAGTGIDVAELLWFRDHPCPPDIVGVNYYVTGERWLDHRVERYPQPFRGRCGGRPIADIETARALATPTPGIGPLLEEAWERYRLPMAITEVHIDAGREDQLRWLHEVWSAAERARRDGVDVRAVTVWALLGSHDWNCLVTADCGHYEPGAFDTRSPLPRPTALATLARQLASGATPDHPALQGRGWWRRPGRLLCPPVASPGIVMPLHWHARRADAPAAQPLLVAGASGTLGQAFAAACRRRDLAVVVLDRQAMDVADPGSVAAALAAHRPWAVINATGHVRIDEAESDQAACMRANALGPAVLAACCAASGVGLLTFSSEQVFDGREARARVESDPIAPLNVYGRSKAAAEASVAAAHPGAMIVRASAFFGHDRHNFVVHALEAMRQGLPFDAADDCVVSPTYVPDLVDACLDLLIDDESGVWHLANAGDASWHALAMRAAAASGVDSTSLRACPTTVMGWKAERPRHAALASERARLMPSLDDALRRFAERWRSTLDAEPRLEAVGESPPADTGDVRSVGT